MRTTVVVLTIFLTFFMSGCVKRSAEHQVRQLEAETKEEDIKYQRAGTPLNTNNGATSDSVGFEGEEEDINPSNLLEDEIQSAEIDYCALEPIIGEGAYAGILLHPIDPKYNQSGWWMGRLFTEDDCGGRKFDDLFGVTNGVYWPGADIILIDRPTKEFLSVLKELGFKTEVSCKTDSDNECIHWILSDKISIPQILRIKQFLNQIKTIGCINCG